MDMDAHQIDDPHSQPLDPARAAPTGLQQDGVVMEHDSGSAPAAILVQANEQLVLAALQAQAETATLLSVLEESTLSAGLDALTGLPDRTLLLHRFAQAMATTKRHGGRLAVLFLDLDQFKPINDRLGHAVGDEVLKLAARCLASSVRDADTVGRYGGDEFLILLPEVFRASDASLIARKINTALAAIRAVGSHDLQLRASIGISIYPDDGLDADALIELADAAMYRAKRHGPGSVAFHGQELVGSRVAPAPAPVARDVPAWAEHEHRFADLRDANERLSLAALEARESLATVEWALQHRTAVMLTLARGLRDSLETLGTAAAALTGAAAEERPRLDAVIRDQVTGMGRLVSGLYDLSQTHGVTPQGEREPRDRADPGGESGAPGASSTRRASTPD